jgi:dolichol-phosphate mannosyltransferase
MANEGDQGCRLVTEALARCTGFRTVKFFAVVDSITKDNTREVLEDQARKEPRLYVVWAPENTCVVDAYMRGYREALAAGADWILEIDAGFSHRPEDIPQFFSTMSQGYDCVFGSRLMKGGGFENSSLKRRIVSVGGTILTNLVLGTRLTDMTSGFELFSRKTLEMVLAKGVRSRAHFFQTEIKVHCHHLHLAEVPIVYRMTSPQLVNGPIFEAFEQLARLFWLRCKRQL